MQEEQPFPMCVVCGFPPNAARLIRLSWIDGPEMSERVFDARMIVVEDQQSNDVLVCEKCIRDIKRLPLTSVTADGPHVLS